uniref:Sorting nexin-29-like n=2 Tax=Hirondellea gigas TaxID=1518452 RepID=A0A6A7G2B2_9CRUS
MDHSTQKEQLLTEFLGSVKACQVKYSGQRELATEADPRVSSVCASIEQLLYHGITHHHTTTGAATQSQPPVSTIRQVTEYVSQGLQLGLSSDGNCSSGPPLPAQGAWQFLAGQLTAHEGARFLRLRHVSCDTGRVRAWIRSGLNEHSIERYFRILSSEISLLERCYEPWAFMRDEDKTVQLPQLAHGLCSIFFALIIDQSELCRGSQCRHDHSSSNRRASTGRATHLIAALPRSKSRDEGLSAALKKREFRRRRKKVPSQLVSFDEALDTGSCSGNNNSEHNSHHHKSSNTFSSSNSNSSESRQDSPLWIQSAPPTCLNSPSIASAAITPYADALAQAQLPSPATLLPSEVEKQLPSVSDSQLPSADGTQAGDETAVQVSPAASNFSEDKQSSHCSSHEDHNFDSKSRSNLMGTNTTKLEPASNTDILREGINTIIDDVPNCDGKSVVYNSAKESIIKNNANSRSSSCLTSSKSNSSNSSCGKSFSTESCSWTENSFEDHGRTCSNNDDFRCDLLRSKIGTEGTTPDADRGNKSALDCTSEHNPKTTTNSRNNQATPSDHKNQMLKIDSYRNSVYNTDINTVHITLNTGQNTEESLNEDLDSSGDACFSDGSTTALNTHATVDEKINPTDVDEERLLGITSRSYSRRDSSYSAVLEDLLSTHCPMPDSIAAVVASAGCSSSSDVGGGASAAFSTSIANAGIDGVQQHNQQRSYLCATAANNSANVASETLRQKQGKDEQHSNVKQCHSCCDGNTGLDIRTDHFNDAKVSERLPLESEANSISRVSVESLDSDVFRSSVSSSKEETLEQNTAVNNSENKGTIESLNSLVFPKKNVNYAQPLDSRYSNIGGASLSARGEGCGAGLEVASYKSSLSNLSIGSSLSGELDASGTATAIITTATTTDASSVVGSSSSPYATTGGALKTVPSAIASSTTVQASSSATTPIETSISVVAAQSFSTSSAAAIKTASSAITLTSSLVPFPASPSATAPSQTSAPVIIQTLSASVVAQFGDAISCDSADIVSCSPMSSADEFGPSVGSRNHHVEDYYHDYYHHDSASSLSIEELRKAVLDLSRSREASEGRRRNAEAKAETSEAECEALREQLEAQRTRTSDSIKEAQAATEATKRENVLLRKQLGKYISAVQLLKREEDDSASKTDAATITGSNAIVPANLIVGCRATAIPPPPPHRMDYHTEAAAYESKLVQVAEMHGELFEFSERLQKIIRVREAQMNCLRRELVTLRGPLPEDVSLEQHLQQLQQLSSSSTPQHHQQQHHSSDDTDTVSLCSTEHPVNVTHTQAPLINVWIPSAFLVEGDHAAAAKGDQHHVYQVYVRIRDDEWTVYRRFTHFHQLHKHLSKTQPPVRALSFPHKKPFGYKDESVVEGRRVRLQDYLRQVVNILLRSSPQLAAAPDRTTLSALLPFLASDKTASASGGIGGGMQSTASQLLTLPQYSGL